MPQDKETMPLSDEEIIEIMQALNESQFDELRLETAGLKLILSKGRVEADYPAPEAPGTDEMGVAAAEDPAPERTVQDVTPGAGIQPPDSPDSGSVQEAAASDEAGLIAIKSPILGFFYGSPQPGAPPFVEVGRHVQEEDTVCLVEVMKLFNSVKAGVEGRIARICVESGKMVEFDQTLFLVEPDGAGQELS